MAKKGGNKDGYESSLNMPSEQKSIEPSRHKISKIMETFPDCSRDYITKLLQYYNDDENTVIDALTRDGGVEASTYISESANLKNKNNKNKKKKKKNRKESNSTMSATASFDADDSSSLHSSSNIDQEGEKEASQNENVEALDESIKDNELFPSQERIDTPENVDTKSEGPNNSRSSPKKINTTPERIMNEIENACTSPVSDISDKNDKLKQNKDRFRFNKDDAHSKYVSRQRTGSFHRSKTNSLSDDNTSQNSAQAPPTNAKKGAPAVYDRCKKDLNRQTSYLQRIQHKLDKNLEEASKRLKVSFNAVQTLLQKRQEELEKELLKITEEALALIKSRQEQGIELKRRLDRAQPQMESDWGDLRADVKQFVTERKYDDLLGENLWYKYGLDNIEEVIKNFGELQPVKNAYSRRSQPAINNNGNTQGNQAPSPSSSIVNEEINSTTDKNDVSNAAESIEHAPAAEKEAVPQFRNQPQGENRSRVFSNKTFNNSQAHFHGKFNNYNRGGGRGYFRGRGRSNYPRQRYYNYNNKNNYEQSNEYRNQTQLDRNAGINEESSYNDKNVNNNHPKDRNNDNRYHPRGHPHYRYGHSARYRGNMNHRPNNESNPKTETSETTNLNNEKTTVINGYAEN